MKKGGPSHPKILAVSRLLKIHRLHALGLLEQMFHWAYEYCPGGNIGKWSNDVIALGIYWDGDPDELIATFVSLGWLDECKNNRLMIHDWVEHAPNWIHGLVSREELKFADFDPISATSDSVPLNKGTEQVGEGKVGQGSTLKKIEKIVDRWNEFVDGKPLDPVSRMTDKRRKAIRTRLGQSGFDFDAVLKVIPDCPFLLGSTDWKINFDWIFKNDSNWVKVVEGQYKNNGSGRKVESAKGELLELQPDEYSNLNETVYTGKDDEVSE